ncbi:MAG TPA: rod shape-determining protein MreC [bacterium]|nr:rod shape-determining protein MreC [bacterium]
MLQKFYKKSFLFLVIIFFFISLYYLGLFKPLKSFAGQVLKYPLGWSYSAGRQVSSFFNIFKNNSYLIKSNQELSDKLIILEQENIDLKKIIEQKNISDEELLFLSQQNVKAIAAKIISRGISGNVNTLIINKGQIDGLREGMVITAKNGLVLGKIIKTEDKLAHVLLLTDSNSRLSAASDKDKTLVGIVHGNFDLSLKLEYILRDKNIAANDLIVTSGQEELVPAGLIIGTVNEVFEDSRELFKTARIVQPETAYNIDIVNVIMP